MSLLGISLNTPVTHRRLIRTEIDSVDIEASPQIFGKTCGLFKLYITDVDDEFTCSFMVSGGYGPAYGSLVGETERNYYFHTRTNENCIVTVPIVNQMRVTTPAGNGSKIYELIFSPYPSINATIEKIGGAALGGEVVIVCEYYKPTSQSYV